VGALGNFRRGCRLSVDRQRAFARGVAYERTTLLSQKALEGEASETTRAGAQRIQRYAARIRLMLSARLVEFGRHSDLACVV
jgi:hypothetical protein